LHGKAKFGGVACRKRLQRERDALRAQGPKQFGLTMQLELPCKLASI
jgi:hypothetical protein